MKHLLLLGGIMLLSFQLIAQDSQDSLKVQTDTATVEYSSFFVFFPTAVHTIDTAYFNDLNQIAEQLLEHPDSVQILGFTDNVGNPQANQKLSEQRAMSVQQYLINAGIDSSFVRLAYFGEEQPQADNSTVEGRRQNRRVEIQLQSSARAEVFSAAGDTSVYAPGKADELLTRLLLPAEARLISKKMPYSKTPSEVSLSAREPRMTGTNGGTVLLKYNYKSGETPPKSVLFQIRNAQHFYDFPVTKNQLEGQIEIPVSFPPELGQGEVAVVATLINKKGRISQPDTTLITMERVGTGKLQISLSWDNDSDQDLYVIDPANEIIFYSDRIAKSGGRLDRDDTDGFGPENIFWKQDAPDGKYVVKVDDYWGHAQKTAFVVTFNGMGVYRQFNGTTHKGSTASVAIFYKKGDTITWEGEEVAADE